MTLGLGLLFVAGSMWPGCKLRSQGLYMATNPSSSFFYLFTALHALHVLGGLAGLTLVIVALQQAGSDAARQHVEHGFVLLAFHGRVVDLSAVPAVERI